MKRILLVALLLALAGGAVFFLSRGSGQGPVVGGLSDDAREDGPAPGLSRGPTTLPKRPPTPGPAMEPDGGPGNVEPADGASIAVTVMDDETGQPVAGAIVTAESVHAPCPRPPAIELFGAVRGEPGGDLVRMTASDKGGLRSMTMVWATTHTDGTAALPWGADPKADLAARKAGYVVGAVCDVAAATPVTIRLRRGLTIEGVVVTPDGKPIAGAVLTVGPAPGTPNEPGHVEAAQADGEGRFVLTGLVPGPVVVGAEHPKYMPARLEPMEPGRKGVQVVMVPALLVSFLVTTDDGKEPETPSAAWRTTGQPPREGLQLLMRADVPKLPDVPVVGTAFGGGPRLYEPVKVPCDRPSVTFTVKAVGCSPWVSEALELPREGGEAKVEVALVRDPTLGNLKVTLEDRDHVALSYVREQCRVQIGRRDGKLVPAGVIVKPGDALEIPALPAGPYVVVVYSPGHAPARGEVDVAAVRETELHLVLGPPAKLRVRFRAPETLIVRFRLLQGRELATTFVEGAGPAPGTGDTGEDDAGGEQALPAGPEGALLTGLGTGRYTVEVISPELSAPATPVDLTEGDTKEVEISVTRR